MYQFRRLAITAPNASFFAQKSLSPLQINSHAADTKLMKGWVIVLPKTTEIRRAASASRHHGGSIEGPSETTRTSLYYHIEGIKEMEIQFSHCKQRTALLRISVDWAVRLMLTVNRIAFGSVLIGGAPGTYLLYVYLCIYMNLLNKCICMKYMKNVNMNSIYY